jgi:hypothetical protein
VLEFRGGVCGAGGGDDAIEAVDGTHKGHVINLTRTLISLVGLILNLNALCTESSSTRFSKDKAETTYRVDGEERHDTIPFRVLVGSEAQTLADGSGHEVGAPDDLGGRVGLARDAACVRIPGLRERVSTILVVAEELLEAYGVRELWVDVVSLYSARKKQRNKETKKERKKWTVPGS